MPRFLLYEFITGGGLFSWAESPTPAGSLLSEGRAMRDALAADLAALPDAEVWLLADTRLPLAAPAGCRWFPVASADAERTTLRRLAADADRTLLIAPEFAGCLFDRVRWAEEVGARLASPGSELVALAADKHATATRLAAAGVPAPAGVLVSAGEPLPRAFPYPAILKPNDGCGSLGVQQVATGGVPAPASPTGAPWRLERWAPGMSVSQAALCGPGGFVLPPACRQHIDVDRAFAYQGGSGPLADDHAARARRLVSRAVESLPAAAGYVGFDLVLGATPADDCVIEVNPRLTTSYLGLRALMRRNLAAALLAAVDGQPPELWLLPGRVEFSADGKVRRHAADSVVAR